MPATKESKYERVEKVAADKNGATVVREVGVDRGKEDPAMNYQNGRQANLVPGAPAGRVPLAGAEVFDADRISTSGSERSNSSASFQSRQSANLEAPAARQTSEFSSSSRSTVTGGPIAAASERSSMSSLESRNLERQLPPQEQMRSQRTTIVTESSGIQGGQRTVPIVPQREVREQHEVIQHETHQRAAGTTTVTIPVTRFESATLESTRHGRTFTEDRELTIPAPVVAPEIMAKQQINLSGGTSAEIHATTDVQLATEAEIHNLGPEEYARYRAKVEALARQQELETSEKAAAYRTEVERDAELIRQTLERQHIRDIEFRKDMVESSVDRQQHEIQLEAEYAMRALELEREAARSVLDKAKSSTSIDVNIDSAIGTTHSQGRVTTTAEHRTDETKI